MGARLISQEQRQEMFDKVLTTIRQRGYTRAADQTGICQLCTKEGIQCALGILVDASPGSNWEARGRLDELFLDERCNNYWGKFASQLRAAHNRSLAVSRETFERHMGDIAEAWGLHYSPLPRLGVLSQANSKLADVNSLSGSVA